MHCDTVLGYYSGYLHTSTMVLRVIQITNLATKWLMGR